MLLKCCVFHVLLAFFFMSSSTLGWGAEVTPQREKTERWSFINNKVEETRKFKYIEFLHNGNTIEVDASEESGDKQKQVPENFYASNLVFNEMLPKEKVMKEIPLSLIRLGGQAMSRTNLKTGLSSVPYQTGKFHTTATIEQMIKQVRSLGAEPIVQLSLIGARPERLPDGSHSMVKVDVAVEAYEMVKYLNGELKLDVKHFSLDSEPLSWHFLHPDVVTEPLRAKDIVDRMIRVSVAIRQAQKEISGNPYSVKIYGIESSQMWNWFRPASPQDCFPNAGCELEPGLTFNNFIEYALFSFARAEKERSAEINPEKYHLLDYVSLHAYPTFRKVYEDVGSFITHYSGIPDLKVFLSSLDIWDTPTPNYSDMAMPGGKIEFLPWLKETIKTYYPKAKMAFTDVRMDVFPHLDYHPLASPLFLSEFMAIAIENGVEVFATSHLNATLYSPQTSALISAGSKPSLTARAISLMATFHQGRKLSVKQTVKKEEFKALRAYATQLKDRINVVVFNRSRDFICSDLYIAYKKAYAPREIIGHCFLPFSMNVMSIPYDTKVKTFYFYRLGLKEVSPAYLPFP